MTDLFRDEVLREQRSSFLGPIRIGRNPSFTAVAVSAVFIVLAISTFALWGTVTKRATLVGVLVPTNGMTDLSAPSPGTVLSLHVSEGQSVVAGQPLIVVRTDRATHQGQLASIVDGSLAQRQNSLREERGIASIQAAQRRKSIDDRLRAGEAERVQLGAELRTLKRRMELSQRSVQRFEQLAREGFVSESQVHQKQEELLDLSLREQGMQRSLVSLDRDLMALQAEKALSDTNHRSQLAQIDRTIAALDQEAAENRARGEVVINAPYDGKVTRLSLHQGQAVGAGQVLATLVPISAGGQSSPLEAHLFAPSRLAGFVKPGQKVWLRYAAYPYQKFGMAEGRIRSVSHTPLRRDEAIANGLVVGATGPGESAYRITVSLQRQTVNAYGAEQPLKPGLTLDADVIQGRRAIWEWLLDPFLAASAKHKILSEASRPADPDSHSR